jgi:hypothetical protein
MDKRRIHVRANSGFLRRALELFLAESLGESVDVVDESVFLAGHADMVITVDSSCPPAACAELARSAAAVIVLAAIPRPVDEARYRAAGAVAYLPMEVSAHSLLAAASGAMPGVLAPSRGQ